MCCDSVYLCKQLRKSKKMEDKLLLFSSAILQGSFFSLKEFIFKKIAVSYFSFGKFTEGRETERGICEFILNFSEQLYIYKWKLWKAFKKLSVEARKINFILISERLSPYLYSLLKVLTETLHRGKFLFPTSLLRIKPLRRCTVIQHLNALIVKSYRKHLISCFYNFCKFSRVYFLFTATQISLLLYNSYLETCF